MRSVLFAGRCSKRFILSASPSRRPLPSGTLARGCFGPVIANGSFTSRRDVQSFPTKCRLWVDTALSPSRRRATAVCAFLPLRGPARKGSSGSNRRVQSAFRERSVLAPLSHSVYDRFFWPGGTGGVGLSGRRGEIGNHKVAGKIGVTTMAALPRNHENAVKSRTWRRFSLPSTLQRSARRAANLSKECRRGHLFFAQPRWIACLLGDA